MIRLALVLLALWPMVASAQANRRSECVLVIDSLPNSTLWQLRDENSGLYTSWWGGGFRARCRGTTMVLSADSAEYSGAAKLLTLVGHARYAEEGTTLTADFIRYFEFDTRVEAQGNVRLRTDNNTTLTALQMIHLRDIPNVRQSSTLALGRPRAVLRDSASTPDSLVTTIDADRLYAWGDSLVYGGGNVIIKRADLTASADSTEANANTEFLRLFLGDPRIETAGERPFVLRGRILDVFAKDRSVSRLFAKGAASVVSDSLTLDSDTLDIGIAAGEVERVRAWGASRAHAVAAGRDIRADSIDLRIPGQRLQELMAIGRARVETPADTSITTTESDWIEGDTVRALFDSTAKVDSGAQPPLLSLESRGSARTFYQLAPSDPRETLPSINYVTGRRIDVAFLKGEVNLVHVTDQARGIFLEPNKTAAAAPPPVPPPGGTAR
jgi:lipopolysaccharide export system protein LptA